MSPEEISRKERRRLEDRNCILDAALQLFSQKGYHNVSMNEIAAKADFAVGTLYKFFKTKEDLYETIFVEMAHKIISDSLEVISQPGEVLTLLYNHLKFASIALKENQDLIRLYFVEVHNLICNVSSCLNSTILEIKAKSQEKEIEVMKRGIEEGVFRDVSPEVLQITYTGLFEAFVLAWIANPEKYPEGIDYETILDLFLNGASVKNEK